MIFEWANSPFHSISLQETGNSRREKAACYHLRIICFHEAALSDSLTRTHPLPQPYAEAWLFFNYCCTSNSQVGGCSQRRTYDKGDVLLCKETVCPAANAYLSGLAQHRTDLGRKTLSTT